MNTPFKKAAEAYKSLALAKKQLDRVQSRIQEAHQQLTKLDQMVDKEYKEYQELENANIRKLFNRVLGKGDDQLEKEKQDYLEAVLNYNQKKKELELMEFEQKILNEKLANEKIINATFDRELKTYSEELIKSNSKTGQLLLDTEKTIRTKLGDLKEIDEALESGKAVLEQLARILQLLNKAGWWGAPEWKKGNPLKVAANKIETIDMAVKLIPIANHKLQKFLDELKDIYLDNESKLNYNQTAFSQFSHGFHDALIIDWVLKGKAKNAINTVSSTHDKLEVTLKSLQMRRKNLLSSVMLLQQRKRDVAIKNL
jgi:hypothetical protein